VLKFYFVKHYFSPLKTFMRKDKDRIREAKNMWVLRIWIKFRIPNSDHYNADPDPVFRLNVDPDPGASQTVGQLPANSTKRLKVGLRIRITIRVGDL
jgi:hypothetical protein